VCVALHDGGAGACFRKPTSSLRVVAPELPPIVPRKPCMLETCLQDGRDGVCCGCDLLHVLELGNQRPACSDGRGGVAWRGVAWRGVAWRGVAWRGVAARSGLGLGPGRQCRAKSPSAIGGDLCCGGIRDVQWRECCCSYGGVDLQATEVEWTA
jgi:hypothetical protein